jgi:hypothetical protein
VSTWDAERTDGDRSRVVDADDGVHFKKVSHRTWSALYARLGFTLALFNILVQWDGFPVDADGIVRLSIAQFSL